LGGAAANRDSHITTADWRSHKRPYSPFAIRTSIVLALDALLAFVTLLVLLAIVSPDNAGERFAIALVAVVLIAIDALLAHVTIKRIRSKRQPETP
jgi:hypothetical protein